MPAKLGRIGPNNVPTKPCGRIVRIDSVGRAQNESARCFPKLADARLQPRLRRERSCQHYRRSTKPGELGAELRIILTLWRRKPICSPELSNGSIQILYADDDLRDSGEIGSGWFAAGVRSPLARREVVNQEWKEVL